MSPEPRSGDGVYVGYALLTKIDRNAIQKTWYPGNLASLRRKSRSATRARFELYSKESGSASAPAKKGSCEIQGDRVEIRHNQLVPRNLALTLSPMAQESTDDDEEDDGATPRITVEFPSPE
jgi:hypothetical protein